MTESDQTTIPARKYIVCWRIKGTCLTFNSAKTDRVTAERHMRECQSGNPDVLYWVEPVYD